jgi:hypothetical protein
MTIIVSAYQRRTTCELIAGDIRVMRSSSRNMKPLLRSEWFFRQPFRYAPERRVRSGLPVIGKQ